VLSVEDWAEIRRLRRSEQMSISEIARVLGVSRNTVRSALASDGPPKYERRPAGSVVDAVEPRIRELLRAYPSMPATVIADRVGWTRSIRVLSGRVAELRPAYLPPDPASRTSYEPGEIAQCDLWFPPITLPVGFGQARRPAQLPVLTMVTGYSRWLAGVLIPSRCSQDLIESEVEPTGDFWRAAIFPNGSSLATASLDRTMRIGLSIPFTPCCSSMPST
jgi:transposase